MPERLGSFGFIEGSERIIAAFESGFAYYHPETAALEWISRPKHAASNVRFNDGRVDRHGRFWAGSMVEGAGDPTGKLYCLGKGVGEVHLTGINITNSLCFSPDGRHLYFADSPLRTILRFDLIRTRAGFPIGKFSRKRRRAHSPTARAVDARRTSLERAMGRRLRGALRTRWHVSGRVELPVSQPTCVAFGGDALDLLFITSAKEGFDAATLATSLTPATVHLPDRCGGM